MLRANHAAVEAGASTYGEACRIRYNGVMVRPEALPR
jgi:hypothetical protein